jgi:hypothetical protein
METERDPHPESNRTYAVFLTAFLNIALLEVTKMLGDMLWSNSNAIW